MSGRRTRKPVSYKEDDFLPEKSGEDPEKLAASRKKKSPASRKKKDKDFQPSSEDKPSRPSRTRTPPQPGPQKRRHVNTSGPLSLREAPKAFSDLVADDLAHDPAGRPCRFLPYAELREHILDIETMMEPGEHGLLTFLPGFKPGDPRFLEYFGFTPDLVKTDLAALRDKSEEELLEMLENTEAELRRLPKPREHHTIAIPGFAPDLRDSVAINADVRTFDWAMLGRVVQFDVITMDPPWQITVTNVTRGVNISYAQLDTPTIAAMPLHYVQSNGYLFMWVIASQVANGSEMLRRWGYRMVGTINWIKISKYGRYMPSHGYYMQHNKETVLVGLKGNAPARCNKKGFDSLIVAQRGVRQSHKPDEIYEIVEKLCPEGMYLEVFARTHNLRAGWVSIGIELPT
jgi:N6-adenosine-specific RNA methylase IME4